MELATRIPTRWRAHIYTTLATVFGVEFALDAVDWGVIPNDFQSKLLIVLGALGFVIARANTTEAA